MIQKMIPTAVLWFAALVTTATAQPLIDYVPHDVLWYAGWRGIESMGDKYEKSHFKAVLEAADIPSRTEQLLALSGQLGFDDAANTELQVVIQSVSTLGAATWKHSTVVYFSGVSNKAPGEFIPQIAVLWQAGEDAEGLVATLQALVAQAEDADLTAFQDGGIVALCNGLTRDDIRKRQADSLKVNVAFQASLRRVQEDPVTVFYINGKQVVGEFNRLMESDPSENQEKWKSARESLGLDGFNQLVWAGGFEGQDWTTGLFIDAPSPRRGVLKMLDGAAVSKDLFKLVPKASSWFSARRFDLAAVLREVRAVVEKIDPEYPSADGRGARGGLGGAWGGY